MNAIQFQAAFMQDLFQPGIEVVRCVFPQNKTPLVKIFDFYHGREIYEIIERDDGYIDTSPGPAV